MPVNAPLIRKLKAFSEAIDESEAAIFPNNLLAVAGAEWCSFCQVSKHLLIGTSTVETEN